MKVYLFYLENDVIDTSEFPAVHEDSIMHGIDKDYSLYAFTNNKEYRDIFKEIRDMTKFKTKTVELTNAQYEDFSNRNSYYELSVGTFTTKCVDEYGVISMVKVGILSTSEEKEIIFFNYAERIEDQFNEESGYEFYRMIYNEIFSKELLVILREYFYSDFLVDEIYRPIEDINPEGYDFDEFSIYIRLFGNTFRKDW